MATAAACRPYRANFKRIPTLETQSPLAVRRQVSFRQAIHENSKTVEEIEALRVTENGVQILLDN